MGEGEEEAAVVIPVAVDDGLALFTALVGVEEGDDAAFPFFDVAVFIADFEDLDVRPMAAVEVGAVELAVFFEG